MSFYVLGDMGSGEESQNQVARALKEKIGNKKTFICGLGDNIYEQGVSSVDDEQFNDKFEKPYSIISDDVTFWMCLGNHDYGYSNLSLNPVKNAEYQIKYSKKSKKWNLPKKYYTFKKGNVEFFVLDTNLDMYSLPQIKKQLQYMKKAIQQSNAQWKIVYGHHTLKSIGGHGEEDTEEFEQFFTELFKAAPFDLYMCGHDHNKQVINYIINNKQLVLIVCGTGGKVYEDDINFNRLDDDCDLEFYSNNLGFGEVNTFHNKLRISFFDGDGSLEYIHEINK
jgi:tartrate-resistant acid phosphatase type 5